MGFRTLAIFSMPASPITMHSTSSLRVQVYDDGFFVLSDMRIMKIILFDNVSFECRVVPFYMEIFNLF